MSLGGTGGGGLDWLEFRLLAYKEDVALAGELTMTGFLAATFRTLGGGT